MRFDLSDEEWAVIEPLLPKGGRGPKRMDDRRVLNGIFYILRTGAPWRDLPERYGPRTTIYNRYARWARRGIWKAIFDGLAEHSGDSLCQWRSKKGPPWRSKKGPLGGCGLVPVVHGRAPRATRRALNRPTRRRAREGPVGPRGQAWAGWSVQFAVGV